MADAKHTPAPWVVGPVDDTVVTHVGADGKRYEVAAIDGDYNQPDEWPVMEANARLIAAAPELLGALRWLRAWWMPGSDHDTDEVKLGLAAADAALAKALGK